MKLRAVAAAGAAAVLLGLGAFTGVYLTMFNPKPVARVSLPAAPTTSPSGAAGGSWTVASGSFVGYRVREKLASLPAPSDAVGRTTGVTGTATTVTGAGGTVSVSAISVKADMASIASDSQRRDGWVRQNYLETDRYPNATFVSDAPFTVTAAASGGRGTATVTGTMTIHGVSKRVSIPLQIQRDGADVDVVGSFTFHWGDYGVPQPQTPFAQVQSDPTIEISLVLAPA